jgi:3-oxoacyl-[acyl-carrier protein] reductase
MTPSSVAWGRLDQIREGQSVTIVERITDRLVEDTARVTGDFNPVHVDPVAARAIGQSRAVAHGVILLGMLSRVIGMQLPGPGAIWFNNKVDFLAPVSPGDDVEMTVTVSRVSPATSVVVLDVTARRLPDVPVLRGTAQVRVPTMINDNADPDESRNHVALVTGGSRGVGRAIAQGLAARGLRVAVNYRSDKTAADETVAALREKGSNASAVPGDVRSEAGVRGVFDATMEAFGRVDVIVHNATPPIELREYSETRAEDFRSFFDTYVVGLHELARLSAAQMRDRKFGRIIAISSSYTAEVPLKLAAYITGKYALVGLCKVLAAELGPSGITVNVVSPSIVVGRRTDDLGMSARDIIARRTPLRRLCEAEDVAASVTFLAGREASFISGANIPVTGGIFI